MSVELSIKTINRGLAHPCTRLNSRACPVLVSAFSADTEPAPSEAEEAGILTFYPHRKE
jgi:hypothetical protein